MKYTDYSHRHGKELLQILHPEILKEVQTVVTDLEPFPHGSKKGTTVKNHLTEAFVDRGWETEGRVDYLFAAFGTCGTITGVGKYLKERNPDVKIIGIEPAVRYHKLSGIKKISNLPEEHRPKILDYSLLDDIIAVEDDEAFDAAIRLARTEGIMVGPTTGACLHAAQKVGADNAGLAVVISPDDATKYISVYAEYLASKEGD